VTSILESKNEKYLRLLSFNPAKELKKVELNMEAMQKRLSELRKPKQQVVIEEEP
jgi:hypothetical protein